MIVGAALVVAAAWGGWIIGRSRSFVPVRMVSWWVGRIIVPLVRTRAWWRCAAGIFLNNTLVLAGVLALGFDRWTCVAAIVTVGMSLGIGLRALADHDDASFFSTGPTDASGRRRFGIGIMLNLLEPPAIVLTLGLSLGQTSVELPALTAWKTFAVVAVPLLALAAAGEALWLGVAFNPSEGNHFGTPPAEYTRADPPSTHQQGNSV